MAWLAALALMAVVAGGNIGTAAKRYAQRGSSSKRFSLRCLICLKQEPGFAVYNLLSFVWRSAMSESTTKLPVKVETQTSTHLPKLRLSSPFLGLRDEIDRFFQNVDRSFLGVPRTHSLSDTESLFSRKTVVDLLPAVDVAENDKQYEITAELPGMDEKDIELKLSNGMLTIKGEKNEKREESDKGYYLSERRYGSFQRSFQVPEGVDADKIEASVKKGVLTVTLPKTPEAQKAEKKIAIKST